MAIKATDRLKIQQFGESLSGTFDQINLALEDLVAGIASANYEGANAVNFKRHCVDDSIRFAESCRDSMQRISRDVHEQTSFIAQNLGGAPIDVAAPNGSVERPSLSSDESIELADSAALNTMKSLVESQMGQIRRAFDDNLEAFELLGRTDGWIGTEYDDLKAQLSSATADVSGEIKKSENEIVGAIQAQLDSLGL